MQTTTHYTLNKPDGTDNYTVANDNANMDAIDTQMYANAQAAAAAQATANAAAPPVATTTADGIVKTSGTSGIAVTTDDPAYEQITGSKYITAGTGISVTAGTNGQTVAIDQTQNQTAPAFIASGLTGATAGARLVGGTTDGAPTSGTWNPGDLVVDQSGATQVYTAPRTGSGTVTPTYSGSYLSLFQVGTTYLHPMQVSEPTTISAVNIALGSGGYSFPATVAISDSSGNNLSGWATQQTVPTSGGTFTFDLPTPPTLTPGNTYYIAFYTEGTYTNRYLCPFAANNAPLYTSIGSQILLGNLTGGDSYYYTGGQGFTLSTNAGAQSPINYGFTYSATQPSQWAQTGKTTSASGTWTPVAGTLNFPAGTIINIALVPQEAKLYFIVVTGGFYSPTNGWPGAVWGTTTSNGSAWISGPVSSTFYVARGLSDGTGQMFIIGDGSYLAYGYFQLNNGYLQFVVTSSSANAQSQNTISWGVA